jgi:hypothetical protein
MAYPVYDRDYSANLAVIRAYLEGFANLQSVGRNGMHRYNNMDHSMQSGILAAENIRGARYNLWQINEEESYLEEEQLPIPKSPLVEKLLRQSFARVDEFAFAAASGALAGLLIFLATIWLIVKGGDSVGRHLQLIGQYFVGYTISVRGAFIAFAYAFVSAFLFGWTGAYLRNLFLTLYLYVLRKKNEMMSLRDLIDHL